MTDERRWGKHIKDKKMLDRNYYQKGYEEELAKVIDDFCKEDPQIFVKEKQARD